MQEIRKIRPLTNSDYMNQVRRIMGLSDIKGIPDDSNYLSKRNDRSLQDEISKLKSELRISKKLNLHNSRKLR